LKGPGKGSRPTIALVAGETSGDQLGATLIHELKRRFPDAKFVGIGGTGMKSAGMVTWYDSEELAVFGLFEVLSHFPRLLRIRDDLRRRLLEAEPDVFIGIDAPDFNLGLETRLKAAGIRTVHYVSPTVWAWREKRVHKIARAADLVLCLFPFEPEFYAGHGVTASYVGHPLADQISPENDCHAARRRLDLEERGLVVSILPGSRVGEVSRLAPPMIGAALQLARKYPRMRFLAAMANKRVRSVFEAAMQGTDGAGLPGIPRIDLMDGDPRTVIAAADVIVCTSGTATLETLLINRPMVVAYKVAPATYWLAKTFRLLKTRHISLPNILAGEALVPELVQNQASDTRLAEAVSTWLDDAVARDALQQRFTTMHRHLRCNASVRAAQAVAEMLRLPDE
jgi:lipid-A-disaccharide synthase